MNRVRRLLRQTLTIARRDFVATVFTPTFLLFLCAPLMFVGFGAIGGIGAATVARGGVADQVRTLAIVAPADAARMTAADTRLRPLFRGDDAPAPLRLETPAADPEQQAHAALGSDTHEVSAALFGPLDAPTILYGAQGGGDSRYLALLAEESLRSARAGTAPLSHATRVALTRPRATATGHGQAALGAVLAIFILTLFLATLTIGTMAEERNSKVVEVLAAAVPLETVFLGKLLGMFGVALLFVGFWGTVFGQIASLLPAGVARAFGEITPAVGGPAFVFLFVVYFAMAYLLLGAAFLGIGAQASTQRELQMLSMPLTILQMAMFGLSSAAAARPGSGLALAAELFPFSSPFAMAAHAANLTGAWPHVAAIAWQLLWVTIVIVVGARAFRRGVLQSGSAGPRWRRRAKAVDMNVSKV